MEATSEHRRHQPNAPRTRGTAARSQASSRRRAGQHGVHPRRAHRVTVELGRTSFWSTSCLKLGQGRDRAVQAGRETLEILANREADRARGGRGDQREVQGTPDRGRKPWSASRGCDERYERTDTLSTLNMIGRWRPAQLFVVVSLPSSSSAPGPAFPGSADPGAGLALIGVKA